jgi:hypothetical protein
MAKKPTPRTESAAGKTLKKATASKDAKTAAGYVVGVSDGKPNKPRSKKGK